MVNNFPTKSLLIFFFIINLCTLVNAQNIDDKQIQFAAFNNILKHTSLESANRPSEHVYLHLNQPWYTRGDTIWFRAYTVIGGQHKLSAISSVAYAELISPKDSVVQKLNLKLELGMASGNFTLPITLPAGTYGIRAYTNYMRNAGEETFYNRPVVIGNPGQSVAGNDKKAEPDLQFFPEGGPLVSGIRNVIAFKATAPDGAGIAVSGELSTASGETIASLQSGYNGMGLFAFTPQQGLNYSATVRFENGFTKTINLPAALPEGYTLTVNNRDADTLLFKVAANAAFLNKHRGIGFYVVAQAAGKVYYTTSAKLNDEAYTVKIAKSRFPGGILSLTLFSENGEPLNERIAFIYSPDNVQVKINPAKNISGSTDKVSLELNSSTLINQPDIASFSAAVINEDKVPFDEMTEPTIFSQLLLNSELHGTIANPAYYLASQDEKTVANLYLLMLTQGYRKLEWKKLADTANQPLKYQPENGLSISGTVKTTDGKAVVKGKVSIFSPQLLLKADTLTNENGRFAFTGLDIEGKAPIILKVLNGKSTNVKITIDQPEKNTGLIISKIINDTSSTSLTAALQKSYKEEEQGFSRINGRLLNDVKISAKNTNKAQNLNSSTNLNGPGNADQLVMGKAMVEQGCATLINCLAAKLAFVAVKPGPPNEAIIDMSRGHGGVMTVYIDGAIGSLDDVDISEVYCVEVLTSTKYKSIYGSDAANGLLLITTKRGIPANEMITKEKAPGITNFTFNGYYKARTFFQPKYDAAVPSAQPSAIFWKPDILTDKDGKATMQYNNLGKGHYRVVVEGIDDEGRLGRAMYRYTVAY